MQNFEDKFSTEKSGMNLNLIKMKYKKICMVDKLKTKRHVSKIFSYFFVKK